MASILTRSQTAARTEDIPKARNVEVEQILGSSKMTGAKELVSREGGEGTENAARTPRRRKKRRRKGTTRHHSSVKEGPSGGQGV